MFILFRLSCYHARQHVVQVGALGRGFVVRRAARLRFLLEQEVHSLADAEERHAGGDVPADYAHLAELAHGGSRVGERAHAGQHDGNRFADGGGSFVTSTSCSPQLIRTALDALRLPLW